jgi:2,4-dienoyl-CoA reductase-like NADH-dependent reductase (Old Yellow Enzyme family)
MHLAHAGRKASTRRPWETPGAVPASEGGWKKVVAPSALAFTDNYPMPQALTLDGIQEAEHIIRTGQADAVIIAREFLHDPYWPLRAAR